MLEVYFYRKLKQSMWIRIVDLTFHGYSVKSIFIKRYLRKDGKCRGRKITIYCREEKLWVPGIWKIFDAFKEWQNPSVAIGETKTFSLWGWDLSALRGTIRAFYLFLIEMWNYWKLSTPDLILLSYQEIWGHSLLMPHNVQMNCVGWEDEHSLSGYEKDNL